MERPEFPNLKTQLDRVLVGRELIDNYSRLGAMKNVWKLLNRFPLVKEWEMAIWTARRQGSVQALSEDSFYQAMPRDLPSTYEDWELIAICAIEATTGIRVTPDQLMDRSAIKWGDAAPGSIAQIEYEKLMNHYAPRNLD